MSTLVLVPFSYLAHAEVGMNILEKSHLAHAEVAIVAGGLEVRVQVPAWFQHGLGTARVACRRPTQTPPGSAMGFEFGFECMYA